MVTVLARKCVRDLWRLRAPVLAIALVAAVGVGNLIMSRATLESLEASRDRYYREQDFADVFVDLRRAPETVRARLASIPGVRRVQTRVMTAGRADIPGFGEPVRLQASSVPEGARALNGLRLRRGRLPRPAERHALVVSDALAEAHALAPGQALDLVLHGRRERFTITGIGASPEFVSQGAPGSLFPDTKRFGIVWIPRKALAGATDMDGAFNSAVFAVDHGARTSAVIRRIDAVLSRYGGLGAIERKDQRSHRYLTEELKQLATMARLFPTVFLLVAAYVLYVVLGRMVSVEREHIGMLRAFGFGRREIWQHYAMFAAAVGLLGALLGIVLGIVLAHQVAGLYRLYFRLPTLDLLLSGRVLAQAVLVSLGSALLGCTLPVLRASRLTPVDAMRPEMPGPLSRRALRGTLQWRLSGVHQLVVRNLAGRPLRSLLAWLGLATGTAVMMMGRFQHDAIDYMIQRQFQPAERQDMSVALFEPSSPRALSELRALHGVLRVEGERIVPIRLRYRTAAYRTALRGVDRAARLRRPLDGRGRAVAPPAGGIVVTDYLATFLGARPGDVVDVEVLNGRRKTLRMRLMGTVNEPFGSQAYADRAVLDRVLGEGPRVDSAALAVDAAALPAVVAQLALRPAVASVDRQRDAIRNFYDGMARTVLTFTVISTVFGAVITAGVTYSSAQVALSERSRDLASLRVLGFTRSEVAYVLLGELALLVALAVPLGFVVGHGLVALLIAGFKSDLYRIPAFVSPATYGIAALITLGSALLAAVPVWRRISSLDLVGVLKARD